MTSHLKEYLDYYKTLEKPGYAVLITGAWGAGKTYQVKQALEANEYFYISLFGLDTVEAVHAEVIAAVHPGSGVYSKVMGKGIQDAGYSGVGSLIPSLLNAAIRRNLDVDRIVIFDDLERSNIEAKDLQGIINSYVEHRGCQVIVIAHDDKVVKLFAETKEKTIGQTLAIEPEVKQAYEHFTKDEKESFLVTYSEDIIDVFNSSQVGSLRILKHVTEDLGRLHQVLDAKYLKHKIAMKELVRVFVALDVEIRAGNISKEDILNRNKDTSSFNSEGFMNYGNQLEREGSYKIDFSSIDEGSRSNLMKVDVKYSKDNLYTRLLSDEVIIKSLFGGLYDKEMISGALNEHPYFVEPLAPEDMPPWRNVIRFDILDDKIIDDAIQKMDKQFEDREVVESGEMLHIFSLRMMLSEQGVIKESLDEVEAGAKQYIDDLLKAKKLPPKDLRDSEWFYEFKTAYNGRGYWVADIYKSRFQSVFEYLVQAREKVLEQSFENFSRDLLEWLTKDTRRFYETVCHVGEYTGYEELPILSSIAPEKFVKAWLSGSQEDWRLVSYALKKRYKLEPLKEERGWIEEVREILKKEADKLEGLARYRIERILPDLTKEE